MERRLTKFSFGPTIFSIQTTFKFFRSLWIGLRLRFFYYTSEKKLTRIYYRLCHLEYETPKIFYYFRLIAYGSYVEIDYSDKELGLRFALNDMDGMTVNIFEKDPLTGSDWTRVYHEGRFLKDPRWVEILLDIDRGFSNDDTYRVRAKEIWEKAREDKWA